jgi:hypothetical protein
VDPRALTRAARDEIRTILGDPALHGGRLAEAIRDLGARHAIEPFRACLGAIAPIDRTEPAAQRLIQSIDHHRSVMQGRLGRDPGFGIAAIDYLHNAEEFIDDLLLPASRAGGTSTGRVRREGPVPESLQQALVLNVRRCERFGRPLALAVLRPDRAAAGRSRIPSTTVAALQGAVRDVDHAARILPEGFAVVLPCTSGQGGVTTAERLRAMLTSAVEARWSAGVASCPEHPWDAVRLARRSQEALARARGRGGDRTEWSHPERRATRRRTIGNGGLSVSLPGHAAQRRIAIDDLSMSGARVRTDRRLAREERVTLALSGNSARSRHVALAARVVRAERKERGAGADWSIGLQFVDDEPARSRIAGLIADLPPECHPAERRSPERRS